VPGGSCFLSLTPKREATSRPSFSLNFPERAGTASHPFAPNYTPFDSTECVSLRNVGNTKVMYDKNCRLCNTKLKAQNRTRILRDELHVLADYV
jgi:hypothetical protein